MKKKYKIPVITLTLVFVTGALFILLASAPPVSKKSTRPNVILVLTDDQGYGDLSIHGNPVIETPFLDQLHNESIRFTDFHSSPMCTPTRGQLMTGLDAYNNGATAVCMGRSMVREELPTMADIFKATGYKTAHFGKWHMGDSYPYRPQDRGFEETVSHGAWGVGSIADYFGNTYWNDFYRRNEKIEKFEGYCTDVWFKLAKDFIRDQKKNGEPFFMYLATNCPHAPHKCDDKYSDPYLARGMSPKVAKFYGQISNIDENMGALLQTLKETKLDENTILIYMTDNGTSSGYEVFNAGMRGHKTSPFEGGHRVPFFVRWPKGDLGTPRDIDVLSECQDVLPTLIDFCKLNVPKNTHFDGTSLLPAFHNNFLKLNERKLVIQYDNPYRPKENKAVMWKKWRLVMDSSLYNLSDDPGQKTDLSREYPDVVKILQDHYSQWERVAMNNYNKPRFIHLGSVKENPLMLYSSDWRGDYADNQANLIAGNRIGAWQVIIDRPGKYVFTLYRWHPASGIPFSGSILNEQGKQVGAIPVAKARLKIGDLDITKPILPNQTKESFTVNLEKGVNQIETSLLNKTGEALCSAYYTKVEFIN